MQTNTPKTSHNATHEQTIVFLNNDQDDRNDKMQLKQQTQWLYNITHIQFKYVIIHCKQTI